VFAVEESSVFVGTVRRSGSSLVVTIPVQIVRALNLHPDEQVWVKIKKLTAEI